MHSASVPHESPWDGSGLEVLGTADFSGERLNRSGTYVVCYSAKWCPVTRRFMPKFSRLKGTLPATFAIADITDLQSPLWDSFRIRITPSIVVFRDGVILQRVDGKRFFGIRDARLAELTAVLARR